MSWVQIPPAAPDPLILITGATGLIGGEWLDTMLAKGGERRILVLTRKPERFRGVPGVEALLCDLAAGQIRIPDELLAGISEIIHCAADIRFGVPLEAARAINVEGTRRMLEVARRCPRLLKFAHISSVYAAGKLEGVFPEQPFLEQQGFFNAYQQSKYEAERLVLAARDAVPVAIFRLSSVIGNSRGEVRQFNYFHHLLKMIPNSGSVPVVAGNPLGPVDLIAGDWAVMALDHLFEHCFQAGRIYHICAGSVGSWPVRRLVDVSFHRFAMRPPRLVSLEEFERFAAARKGGSEGVIQEMLRVLEQFLPHLALYQSFENARTKADLERAGVYMPALESYYQKIIDYCVLTNWGKTPSRLTAANGRVGAAQSMGRDAKPIEDLQHGPTSEGGGEAAAVEPPR